MQKLQLD